MANHWLAIAKAEFFVLTSRIRRRRKIYVGSLFTLGIIWATTIAPMLIGTIMNSIIPMKQIRVLLMVMFPSMMRIIMMLLWFMLLLFPLADAMKEIKIGQWEIFLSNNVRTRDILTGTFLGKVPLYGLAVLFLAPVLISPFTLAFKVSLPGLVLIYSVVVLMVLSTTWLSNFITALIQAKLGDSPRGDDLAKALTVVISMVVILPMLGVMYFAPQLSAILGKDDFLMMPFTWYADAVSWLAIVFNEIGLTELQIFGFQNILQLDLLTNVVLMSLFGLAGVVIALLTADRVFTISAGARTEIVTTVGHENLVLRGIRRVSPGPFGTLMVVNLKDFLRKAQNLSRIILGIIFAVMIPIIVTQNGEDWESIFEILPMIGIMFAMVGVLPFAGTGFLESKDHLWIIRSAPSGPSRFVKSRLASTFLIAIPLATIPTVTVGFMLQTSAAEFLILLAYAYVVVCGAIMVATGITARNPNYDDTKSTAAQVNLILSLIIAELSMMFPVLLIIIPHLFGVNIIGVIVSIVGGMAAEIIILASGGMFLFVLGTLFVVIGIRSLSRTAD